MTRYDELLRLIDDAGVAPGIGALGQGFQMEQTPVELAHFLADCEALGVKSMLELGTGEYGGLARLCYQKLGWAVTSIDHRAPLHESGRFILGETSDPDVFRQVANERFDLVFVDADHNYSSVVSDHAMYAPLATKAVALHDVSWGREGTQGSCAFWRELAFEQSLITHDYYIPADGDTFYLSHGIKRGFHELIDPNHPIGIGYYEVAHE